LRYTPPQDDATYILSLREITENLNPANQANTWWLLVIQVFWFLKLYGWWCCNIRDKPLLWPSRIDAWYLTKTINNVENTIWYSNKRPNGVLRVMDMIFQTLMGQWKSHSSTRSSVASLHHIHTYIHTYIYIYIDAPPEGHMCIFLFFYLVKNQSIPS